MDNNFGEYIFEMNKGLAVNKEIKLTLKECLEYATKEKLNKIAAIYEVVGRSKMKKGDLVSALCDVITNPDNLQEAFVTLDEEQEELIQILKENESIESTNTPINIYLPLYGKGIVFTYLKNNNIFMVMPIEVKETIKNINSEVMNIKKARFRLIEKYILSMANLYGIYEIDYLIEVFNKQNEEKLNKIEFHKALEKLLDKNGLVSVQGDRLIHEALLEGEGLEELQEEIEGKEYFEPSKDELLKYSDEFYLELSSEHIALKEFLNNLCNNEELAQGILEDICLALIDDSLNVQSALLELERRDIVVANVEKLKEYIRAIDGVNNKTRKWSNKGFTLTEKPQEVVNTSVISEKKVGRNEPCTCGSNKKYKKCCGK